MQPLTIESRRSPLVREAAELGKSAAARRETGLFLCEGARLCRDAAFSLGAVETCFFTEGAAQKYEAYLRPVLAACKSAYRVSEPVAGLLSSTKSPQGVFCVCKWPESLFREAPVGFAPRRPCLVLENLQDPGNLGTVLRTAEALGPFRVFLLGECCDPLSPKALRASMGAVFRLTVALERSAARLRELLGRYGYTLHAAVPDDSARPVSSVNFSEGFHAVFIGNEGNGLTEEALAVCDDRVMIPMSGRAESLNASAAATILLWEMGRGANEGEEGENHGG